MMFKYFPLNSPLFLYFVAILFLVADQSLYAARSNTKSERLQPYRRKTPLSRSFEYQPNPTGRQSSGYQHSSFPSDLVSASSAEPQFLSSHLHYLEDPTLYKQSLIANYITAVIGPVIQRELSYEQQQVAAFHARTSRALLWGEHWDQGGLSRYGYDAEWFQRIFGFELPKPK